jgi:hypothetical protein
LIASVFERVENAFRRLPVSEWILPVGIDSKHLSNSPHDPVDLHADNPI